MIKNQIIDKLDEIYQALSKNCIKNDFSLLIGNSGILLFLVHYEEMILNRTGHSKTCLESIVKELHKAHELPYSFCSGIAGTHWLFSYLEYHTHTQIDYAEITNFVKEFCSTHLEEFVQHKNIDYMHGIGGFFVPCENHPPLAKITGLLPAFSPVEDYLLFKDPRIDSEEVYNLGLAHGYASFMSLVALNSEKGKNLEWVKKMKNIIDKSKMTGNTGLFPTHFSFEKKSPPARLAWCYGDLGIAAAFWLAGKKYAQKQWQEEAIQIMLHNTKRTNLKENGVVDAGICHGTAGIAHFYNRFYKETNIEEFDTARWYWLRKTIEMTRFDDGITSDKTNDEGENRQVDHGLLTGSAGIGLVLLGFLTDSITPLNWDRCLLIS